MALTAITMAHRIQFSSNASNHRELSMLFTASQKKDDCATTHFHYLTHALLFKRSGECELGSKRVNWFEIWNEMAKITSVVHNTMQSTHMQCMQMTQFHWIMQHCNLCADFSSKFHVVTAYQLSSSHGGVLHGCLTSHSPVQLPQNKPKISCEDFKSHVSRLRTHVDLSWWLTLSLQSSKSTLSQPQNIYIM